MGKKKGGEDGRPASPTGASESSREDALCKLHGKLVAAFPHQPHVSLLETEELDPSQVNMTGEKGGSERRHPTCDAHHPSPERDVCT
jgi:hypothetical protein